MCSPGFLFSSDRATARRCLVNRIHQPTQQIGRRWGQHTMPQVKDMPWPVACPPYNVLHALLNRLPGSQQQGGVEVALDAPLKADARPRLIKVNAPIDADDITASLGERLQQAGYIGTKMNRRRASGFHCLED